MSVGDVVVLEEFKARISKGGTIEADAKLMIQLVNAKEKRTIGEPKMIGNFKVFAKTGVLEGHDVTFSYDNWKVYESLPKVTHAVLYAEKEGSFSDVAYLDLGEADLSAGDLTITWSGSGIINSGITKA